MGARTFASLLIHSAQIKLIELNDSDTSSFRLIDAHFFLLQQQQQQLNINAQMSVDRRQ